MYTSNAEWPDCVNVSPYADSNISTDEHTSFEFAKAICHRLMREGFGGEGKVYPIRVWVENSAGEVVYKIPMFKRGE